MKNKPKPTLQEDLAALMHKHNRSGGVLLSVRDNDDRSGLHFNATIALIETPQTTDAMVEDFMNKMIQPFYDFLVAAGVVSPSVDRPSDENKGPTQPPLRIDNNNQN